MLDKLYTGEDEFLDMQQSFDNCETVITELIRFEEPEMSYSMSRVPIGYKKNKDELFNLDLSQSRRILILGSSGSGKTVQSNTIMDRFIKSGGVVSIFDVKGEYTRKYLPLPPEYADKMITTDDGDEVPSFLFPNEKAQGFPINSYYPIFLQNLRKTNTGKMRKLAEYEKLCQLGMESLTKADFFTFFDQITSKNPMYYDVLEELWAGIEKDSLYTWDEIIDFIEDCETFSSIIKKTLVRSMQIFKQNQIIGSQYDEPDLVGDILDDKIGILNLQGLLDLPSAVSPALVYVNILLRRIYNSKVQGKVNKKIHNLIHIDEINKLIPREGDTPSKGEFLKLLDLARSSRVVL